MSKPKVSIIVPVYNVEKFLCRCIDSILAQTFQDFELLLIDDGSSDNSGKICDDYANKDNRIRAFHKENGGVSSARNLGLNQVKGDWVTFVDSDDYIQPGFLKGLYEPIAQGEDLDFVHGGCVNVKNEEIININQSYEYYIGNDKNILFKKLRGLTFSKLFRMENIINHQNGHPLYFDEKMRLAEDLAFTLDYSLYVKRYAFVPEIGYCYRIDNMNSATKCKRIDKYETSLHSFIHLYNSIKIYIEKHKIPYETAKFRLSHEAIHLQDVCMLLYYNDYNKSERIKHLKYDITDEYLSLLKLAKKGIIKTLLFKLLEIKSYTLFDLFAKIIISVKKYGNRLYNWCLRHVPYRAS